jgi:ribonuclease E
MPHNKMLIDATHPEETRVVVLRNGRVEEFDFESATRKLLRGNIYLAKVTRVEPSLQAAFIDYGGNRHGFLAFNEIHPDYYTIPVADRQALLEEEAAADAAEEAEADRRAEARASRGGGDNEADDAEDQAIDVADLLPPETIEPMDPGGMAAEATDTADKVHSEPVEPPATQDHHGHHQDQDAPAHTVHDDLSAQHATAAAGETAEGSIEAAPNGNGTPATAEVVDSVGSEDALEELPARPRRRPRSYKIQEVIKRRQIILVQVVKEERGTKGAALTTYLSLAGRYTVLMPNTARGGGISRKITQAQDRKRLKAIAQELDVPEGMGLIIRTAGAARTSQEIKRDFEYLLRLWENVRDMTLQSTAPSLVYEEGDLIKRSIRDLYTKEVDEILVAGASAHSEARDFMRMLMPSHAKNVIDYREPEPLFNKYQIEKQLNAMFSPYVNLKSGGYLVINQTEALVAIDINSGKSTREFSIEETALATNLEAADEIARQLKLRDLAGLIVIDFIDMEEKRNNRAVERRIKEALRFDRARIQVGRISHFGLLEMSRQRMRTGVLEGSTTPCQHCQGTGIIRSTESVALAVIRALEDGLIANGRSSLVATTSAGVALYILNHKRSFIVDMEHRYGVSVTVQASDKVQGSNFTIEKSNLPLIAARRPDKAAVNMDWGFSGDGEAAAADEPIDDASVAEADDQAEARGPDEGGSDAPRGRRRRRRRGGRRDEMGEGRGERPGQHGGGRAAEGEDDERPARLPTGELEEIGDADEVQPEGRNRHERVRVRDDTGEDGESTRAAVSGERETGDTGDAQGRRGRRRGRRGGRRGGRDREPIRAGGESANGAQDAEEQGHDPAAHGQHHADDHADRGHDHGRQGHVPHEESHEDAAAHRHQLAAAQDPVAQPSQEPIAPVLRSTGYLPPAEPSPVSNGQHELRVVETKMQPIEQAPEAAPKPALHPAERPTTPVEQIAVVSTTSDEGKPSRKGWWQRKLSGE